MTDTIGSSPPAWADLALSSVLSDMVARGEGQDLEFKERIPAQARDLGKEIAAFATSNAGTILLGVSDSGGIVGLMGCETQEGRADLRQRIEGICAGNVRPHVTPGLRFAVVEGRVVLAIDVSKGEAPLYYVSNVPYLRQISAARPAEPPEVIDLVLAWDAARSTSLEPSPRIRFLSSLVSLIIDVVVFTGELEDRQVDPWLTMLRSTFTSLADDARNLASSAPSECIEAAGELETLSHYLDEAGHEVLTIGSGWDEMQEAASSARDLALEIRREWIASIAPSADSVEGLRSLLVQMVRRLASLVARLDQMVDQNRIEEIQSEAGSIGLTLRKIAAASVPLGETTDLSNLERIGRTLREIEIRRLYLDGGQSERKLLEDVREIDAVLRASLDR